MNRVLGVDGMGIQKATQETFGKVMEMTHMRLAVLPEPAPWYAKSVWCFLLICKTKLTSEKHVQV